MKNKELRLAKQLLEAAKKNIGFKDDVVVPIQFELPVPAATANFVVEQFNKIKEKSKVEDKEIIAEFQPTPEDVNLILSKYVQLLAFKYIDPKHLDENVMDLQTKEIQNIILKYYLGKQNLAIN